MKTTTKCALADGSFPADPRKYIYAELLFDLLEALMHHYVISLPLTRVNICFTLSDMNTLANLSLPSETKGKKRLDDYLTLP